MYSQLFLYINIFKYFGQLKLPFSLLLFGILQLSSIDWLQLDGSKVVNRIVCGIWEKCVLQPPVLWISSQLILSLFNWKRKQTTGSYFIVWCVSGRSAFIGIGFSDRGDSFDLLVTMQDHFRYEHVVTSLLVFHGLTSIL